MIIQREDIEPIEFDGLRIIDYTGGQEASSSVAEVSVPVGARHRRAWSKKSDKYYYVIKGQLSFVIGDQEVGLSAGDVCVVRQGEKFSYKNLTDGDAKLLLVHTPKFDLAEEVFEE